MYTLRVHNMVLCTWYLVPTPIHSYQSYSTLAISPQTILRNKYGNTLSLNKPWLDNNQQTKIIIMLLSWSLNFNQTTGIFKSTTYQMMHDTLIQLLQYNHLSSIISMLITFIENFCLMTLIILCYQMYLSMCRIFLIFSIYII